MEGTYPLPEAQLDRFLFKIDVSFPTVGELVEIAERTTDIEIPQADKAAEGLTIKGMQNLARSIPIASHVTEYGASLLRATHPDDPTAPSIVQEFAYVGASPRGLQAMILGGKINALLDGRFNVAYDDIRKMALPALRHRILLNFEAQAEGISTDDIIISLLETVQPQPA